MKVIYAVCRACSNGTHASTGPCRLHAGDGRPCLCRACPAGGTAGPGRGRWTKLAGVLAVFASAGVALGIIVAFVVAVASR